MKCYVGSLPGGGMVTMRLSGNPGDRRPCRCGGRPRVALCDFPVLGPRGATTCSAPMCEGHRHRNGPNLDHCPDHYGKTPEA